MPRNVIFICTGNSARSQMAEALLRVRGGAAYTAYSAGMDAKGMNPMTIKVMDEIGIDVSGQRSKSVREYMGRMSFDDAIIVCRRAEDDCPTLLADAKRQHRWIFDDPAKAEGTEEEKLAVFRAVRDRIDARIQLWLAENTEAERPPAS
ncbi:MAG TPA: arsenate reductase ArsC [Candidatus Limnocylindrales bacterium]|nr:arsenate reductase ArsC [Candidatus Limnocylindrales bacterium]